MLTWKSKIKITLQLLLFVLAVKFSSAQSAKQEIDAMHRRWDTPGWSDTLTNPYKGNAALTDSGKVIYQKICSVCHGTGGKGDGIAAAGLTVHPANHTSPMVQEQTDGSLFYELSNGHAPMPGYKTTLTEKQRWALINYIRTLKPKTPTTKKS